MRYKLIDALKLGRDYGNAARHRFFEYIRQDVAITTCGHNTRQNKNSGLEIMLAYLPLGHLAAQLHRAVQPESSDCLRERFLLWPGPDNFAGKCNVPIFELFAGFEQVVQALLLNQAGDCKNPRFFRLFEPLRELGQINSVVNCNNLWCNCAVERGFQSCRAELAI